MSSLIVLCPHCLTWIEPHAECCTECGSSVNINDDDPPVESLTERVGAWQCDLGPLKLLRRGWPGCGRLHATTAGLLFVPQFQVHSSGALEALADDAPIGTSRVANLFHWLSVPPWRRPAEESSPPGQTEVPAGPVAALDLLLESPGAFFICRESIQRVSIRWGRAQVERRPSRSVTFAQFSNGPAPRDILRQLLEIPAWQDLVISL